MKDNHDINWDHYRFRRVLEKQYDLFDPDPDANRIGDGLVLIASLIVLVWFLI